MTIANALLSEGFDKTIFLVRAAFERRLTNQTNRLPTTPSYHRGQADPDNLPDDPVGVWLDWERMTPDEDQPFGASAFVSHWNIEVVAKDDGDDRFGGESDLGTRVFSAILKSLTEWHDDMGLDGTVDYFPDPEVLHTRGVVPNTTRKVEYFRTTVECHLQMTNRSPPP